MLNSDSNSDDFELAIIEDYVVARFFYDCSEDDDE